MSIPASDSASEYDKFGCNSSNTRQRNLLGFQSPSPFEKASRRRAFLMHTDFEVLVKSDVECLNGLLKLCNLHSSKVLVL